MCFDGLMDELCGAPDQVQEGSSIQPVEASTNPQTEIAIPETDNVTSWLKNVDSNATPMQSTFANRRESQATHKTYEAAPIQPPASFSDTLDTAKKDSCPSVVPQEQIYKQFPLMKHWEKEAD